MARLHPRSLLQTVILLLVLGLASFTTAFESPTGQVVAGVVIVAVGLDILWVTWRRVGGGQDE